MKASTPYRTVDEIARRQSVLREAARVRDALASTETFHHIADGRIASSQEIVDALSSCLAELASHA